MNHKQKTKLARGMMSREERANKTSIFQSRAWESRASHRKLREVTRDKNSGLILRKI